MIQYLDPVPGNKLHSIRTPIIKSITHTEACNEVSTQALCSKPYRLPRGPSRKSSRGLVLVCVFPQMTVNPLFCVEGFVGLVINARVSMNVYVCVAERGYQAGRGPVPSVLPTARLCSTATSTSLLSGWPEKNGAHRSRTIAGHVNTRANINTHTNRDAVRQHPWPSRKHGRLHFYRDRVMSRFVGYFAENSSFLVCLCLLLSLHCLYYTILYLGNCKISVIRVSLRNEWMMMLGICIV